VLEYLRDGKLSVAEKDASELDVDKLQWLKREFEFYCIELFADPQEVAFVVGGIDEDMLSSMERYDVLSGIWREATPMATARANFGLCELSGGGLYAIGGENSARAGVTLASVEHYDLDLEIWSAAPPLPRPRYAHCTCTLNNTVYDLGVVEQNEEGAHKTVNSVLNFNSRTQMWSEVASMPAERDDAGACVLGSDIYIIGGRTEDREVNFTTYRFSTETNKWTTLAPMPEARSVHSVSVLDDLIYVIGGADSDDNPTKSVHRFDPAANSWSAVAPMSIARDSLGSFVLSGCIYAVGGEDCNCSGASGARAYLRLQLN
jgi:N-acetylneuraminic acid mutarotase